MSILKDPKVLDPLGLFDAYLNEPDPEVEALKEKERTKGYVDAPDVEKDKAARRTSRRRQISRRGRYSTTRPQGTTVSGTLG